MISQKELLTFPDLLNAHAAAIEKSEFEQEQCQDDQLRSILQRQGQIIRRHYEMMADSLQRMRGGANVQSGPAGNPAFGDGGVHTGQAPAGNEAVQGGQTQGFQQFHPYRVEPSGRRLSDRAIALSCLEFHKHMAVTMTYAALESASPEIRRMLVEMSREHVEMAYELFIFLSQRHWYAVPPAQQQQVSQVAQGFATAPGGGAVDPRSFTYPTA